MDNPALGVPNYMRQGELRGQEHSSNHGFPRFWNAEVSVHAMTSPLPRDCNLNSRDYAALSSSLPWRYLIICFVSTQNWEEPFL